MCQVPLLSELVVLVCAHSELSLTSSSNNFAALGSFFFIANLKPVGWHQRAKGPLCACMWL